MCIETCKRSGYCMGKVKVFAREVQKESSNTVLGARLLYSHLYLASLYTILHKLH